MPKQMEFHLDVVMADGREWSVVADQRDCAKWEAQPNGFPVGARLEENLSMTFLRYLAYSASVRYGKYTGTIESWGEECAEAMLPDDLEAELGKGDTAPGSRTVSVELSSLSPAPPVSPSFPAASKPGTRGTSPLS